MPARHHSRATRLAATFLARIASADVAAATFRVDPRTVRAWQAGGALPEDQWEAIEATLLARGAEMTARGDTRGLVQTLTGAGIAGRNTRVRELIARREQRHTADLEAEQPDPEQQAFRDAINALPDVRRRFLRDLLNFEVQRREALPPEQRDPVATSDGAVIAHLEYIRDLSDEQFAAGRAELDARITEHQAQVEAQYEQRRQPAPPPEPQPPVPDAATSPPQAPQPSLRVVDDYDHPSWQPWRRDDHW